METLIIGKPAINIYLPLQEFPNEGDIFTIKSKNESVGNVGATSACLLAKWGISTHFTGVVGNDAYAEKIRDTFKEYKVNSKFMETNFENGTNVNYIILNAKNGNSSKFIYNNPEVQLAKFKYDFVPGFAIIDGTDYAGAFALLNNNGSCNTVFYGRVGDKETINLSKRCTWNICTEAFAEGLTKISADGTAESYVNLYQKIVDSAGKSNYVIILNNRKILYSVDGKVKMLPEMKINVVDYSSFDSIFVGAFSYGVGMGLSVDDAIKLANTAAGLSISKIGEVVSIPTLDEVLDNSGLRAKVAPQTNQSTGPAQAQEVTPLNPQVAVQNQAVQQPAMVDQNNVAMQNPQATQVMPQQTSQQQVQAVPQPQPETNMFDTTNV
ncbi:MAG: carbohydrate kinase family protein [Bacilli bacterium]|nr:carbohydrate kinase family protein [Bacilli bacterium]